MPKDTLADHVERRLTGVGSCLSWRYTVARKLRDPEFGWSAGGDELSVGLWPDDSTGGTPPEPEGEAGLSMTIHGNWEAHEFLAVLERMAEDLRSVLGEPWEVYEEGKPDRSED